MLYVGTSDGQASETADGAMMALYQADSIDEWNNDKFERLDDVARLLPSLIVHLITEEDYLPPLDVI